MQKIVIEIRKELKRASSEKVRESGKRFFKENIKLYGVKVPDVKKLARKYMPEVKKLSKAEVFAICEEFWKSGYMEESFVACDFSYAMRKQFKEQDFAVFEKWVKNYITNWASCDTFCNHTVGEFLEMYPKYLPEMLKWTQSKNRWVRRASAVSLIVPARQGKFLPEIFQIADKLLVDKEDMVQKGYGWMLKVASQAHEKEVFDYVMKHKAVMPRTALRYAIEKMPKDLKVKAMVITAKVSNIN